MIYFPEPPTAGATILFGGALVSPAVNTDDNRDATQSTFVV
jgi:hypothetical protein